MHDFRIHVDHEEDAEGVTLEEALESIEDKEKLLAGMLRNMRPANKLRPGPNPELHESNLANVIVRKTNTRFRHDDAGLGHGGYHVEFDVSQTGLNRLCDTARTYFDRLAIVSGAKREPEPPPTLVPAKPAEKNEDRFSGNSVGKPFANAAGAGLQLSVEERLDTLEMFVEGVADHVLRLKRQSRNTKKNLVRLLKIVEKQSK